MMLVVPNFSGIAPRFADRLLDDTQASFVANLKPTSGDLSGFRSLKLEARFNAGPVYRRAIKLYYPGLNTFEWFLNQDVNSDVVKSPLATDPFNRVYYTDKFHTKMQVTTLDDIHNGVPSMTSGVPRPTTAPGVGDTGGTGTIIEDRAYVYTYVNAYGSVGPPSPPTIHSAQPNATWTITIPTVPTGFGITFVDIYRTSTGNQSSGQYYRVGRVASPFGPFNDGLASDLVPLQPPLDSYDNDPAPDNLQGLVIHSSGALAGFVSRTLYFSVPYLPHAWPQTTAYTMPDDIVGIAPIANSIVVLTRSFPVIVSGNTPDTVGIVALTDPEPCTSKRSIVVMSTAVNFASPNGIVSISQNGLTRPTNPLLTRDEFEAYSPYTIVAASYGSYYIAFYEEARGFALALPPYEPISFVPLDRYAAVTGLDTDRRSGDLLITQTNITSLFDRVPDQRFATTFRSKEFITTKPYNFGAFQLLLKDEDPDPNTTLIIEAAETYNETRFAEGPLDTLGSYTLGGSLDMDFEALDPILGGLPPIQPLGGEPLYDVDGNFGVQGVRFTFYVNDDIKFTKVITDEKVHRMPEGYKGTRYYMEVSAPVRVQRMIVAETARECREA